MSDWKQESAGPEGDLSRFDASPDGIVVHTNDTLVCRDCRYRLRPVGKCLRYLGRKPSAVLNGGDCPRRAPKKKIKPGD